MAKETFTKEFRNTLATAIVAAFGFVTALAWNNVIQEFVGKITTLSPVQGQLITAVIITFISVIVILFVTHFIKGK